MQRSELKEKDYHKLLEKILPIILEKGLKGTTMDIVASRLCISKRTLYEVFDSKTTMIKEVLHLLGDKSQKFVNDSFAKADNVMEAFVEIFKYNRDLVKRVNVEFYRDMDNLYKDRREDYEKTRESRHEMMLKMYNLGVEQGMFRQDVDYNVQSRMVGLQMEALKRMEELFPPGITLQRVFDSIIVGYLRSIASPGGMKILDNLTRDIK